MPPPKCCFPARPHQDLFPGLGGFPLLGMGGQARSLSTQHFVAPQYPSQAVETGVEPVILFTKHVLAWVCLPEG